MGNILIGFPNRIDEAEMSGGDWRGVLPLTNIQDRLFARVARSTDAAEASTRFVMDFGRPRRMQIMALVNHNISLTARIEIEASDAEDFSSIGYAYDGDVWTGFLTSTYDLNELEWENDNWWTGGYTSEEIEGLTATSAHLIEGYQSFRYWRIKIRDSLNDAGYVQIGRIYAGEAWQPGINYAYGAALGYEDNTAVETALGGAEFFDIQEPVRFMRFTLGFLTDDEAFGRALEIMRRAGVHGELFVIPDPDNAFQGLRRNFMGRARSLSPVEQAMHGYNSTSFEIKELR